MGLVRVLREGRDTTRQGGGQRIGAVAHLQRLEGLAQRLGPLPGDGQRRLRQQQHEFLAAVPAGQVLHAHVALQQLRQGLQHGVARGVAVGVVDALEVVDVDHQQRQRQALGAALRDPGREGGVQVASVVQAGERVAHGLLLQLVLQRPDFLELGAQPGVALLLLHRPPVAGVGEHGQEQRERQDAQQRRGRVDVRVQGLVPVQGEPAQESDAHGGQEPQQPGIAVERDDIDAVADEQREGDPDRQAQQARPEPAEDVVHQHVVQLGLRLVRRAAGRPVGELRVGEELHGQHGPGGLACADVQEMRPQRQEQQRVEEGAVAVVHPHQPVDGACGRGRWRVRRRRHRRRYGFPAGPRWRTRGRVARQWILPLSAVFRKAAVLSSSSLPGLSGRAGGPIAPQ